MISAIVYRQTALKESVLATIYRLLECREMEKTMKSLDAKIQKVKKALGALGPMRPGSLSAQYNVCGSPGCKCKEDPPKKHGPYYQLSYTFKSRSKSEFVRRENVAVVKRQLANYAKYRKLSEEWVELELERARAAVAKQTEERRAAL